MIDGKKKVFSDEEEIQNNDSEIKKEKDNKNFK